MDCGILFSTYDLLISSKSLGKEAKAQLKAAKLAEKAKLQQGKDDGDADKIHFGAAWPVRLHSIALAGVSIRVLGGQPSILAPSDCWVAAPPEATSDGWLLGQFLDLEADAWQMGGAQRQRPSMSTDT